jgi:hypothetical protein
MTPSKNPIMAIIDIFRSQIECFAAIYERQKWEILPY